MSRVMPLSDAITAVQSGAVGVLPTDTVYGIVCRADQPESVDRLYQLKYRENKPGTLIAASLEQLVDLGIPRRYLTAVEQFWPNSISVVIPAGEQLQYIHQGKFSIACRIPAAADVVSVLAQTGPLLTSSANMPGEPPAETVEQAVAYFGDSVDFYVDGGDLSGRDASTVIRMVDDAVEVLRQGSIQVTESGEIIT